jgi:hypothetical protein
VRVDALDPDYAVDPIMSMLYLMRHAREIFALRL